MFVGTRDKCRVLPGTEPPTFDKVENPGAGRMPHWNELNQEGQQEAYDVTR